MLFIIEFCKREVGSVDKYIPSRILRLVRLRNKYVKSFILDIGNAVFIGLHFHKTQIHFWRAVQRSSIEEAPKLIGALLPCA